MNFNKIKNNPKLPKHLAVIIDGNGRWAMRKGLKRSSGHRVGYENVIKLVDNVEKLGIECLSLYAFSTENWARPKEEVDFLLQLFDEILDKFKLEYMDRNIKIVISGDMNDERIPKKSRDKAKELIELTKNKTGLIINSCFNYGGRQEILNAVSQIIVGDDKIVTPELIESHLYTTSLPALDLIIRTSGELRLSNFMLWQSAYSELYFTKTLWPNFSNRQLLKALNNYMKRNRRFGKIKG